MNGYVEEISWNKNLMPKKKEKSMKNCGLKSEI